MPTGSSIWNLSLDKVPEKIDYIWKTWEMLLEKCFMPQNVVAKLYSGLDKILNKYNGFGHMFQFSEQSKEIVKKVNNTLSNILDFSFSSLSI